MGICFTHLPLFIFMLKMWSRLGCGSYDTHRMLLIAQLSYSVTEYECIELPCFHIMLSLLITSASRVLVVLSLITVDWLLFSWVTGGIFIFFNFSWTFLKAVLTVSFSVYLRTTIVGTTPVAKEMKNVMIPAGVYCGGSWISAKALRFPRVISL